MQKFLEVTKLDPKYSKVLEQMKTKSFQDLVEKRLNKAEITQIEEQVKLKVEISKQENN